MNYKESYQKIVLENFKCQKYTGVPEYYNLHHTVFNRMCGDVITLYIYLKDDRIEEIKFTCEGCAVTKASAVLMVEKILKEDLFHARSIYHEFLEVVEGELQHADHLGQLNVFSGINSFPSRKQCALLPWQALMTCIELPSLAHA